MRDGNQPHKYHSTQMVLSAPMSFVGAGARMRRLFKRLSWKKKLLAYVPFVMILTLWWTFIMSWYVVFGMLVVPYRLFRRGHRRRRMEDQRQYELIEAMHEAARSTP